MSIKILIDEPQEKYSSGQSILGRVVCRLKIPNFIEVKIKLVGEECTQYDRAITNNVVTLNHGQQRKFLETKDILLHKGRYKVETDYEYRFNLTLPRFIPSSYSGRYGHVKFFMSAYMNVHSEGTFMDQIELVVFSPIDLNHVLQPLADYELKPSSYTDEFTQSNSLWCIPEFIRMHVKLKKKVFALNEDVPVEVLITNKSSMPVTKVSAKILTRVEAKLGPLNEQQEVMNAYELLGMKEDSGVQPHEEEEFKFNVRMEPDSVLPNFEKCTLFRQTSFLEVTAYLRGRSRRPDLKIEAGLILGHIPIERHRRPLAKKVQDVAIIRKITGEVFKPEEPLPTQMPMASTSTHPFRENLPYPPLPPGLPPTLAGLSLHSTSGIPHFPTPLPASYSVVSPESIGFNILPSTISSTEQPDSSSTVVRRPGFTASAPQEDETDTSDLIRAAHTSSTNVAESLESSPSRVIQLPTPPSEEVDAPPSYAEAMFSYRKEKRSQEIRKEIAS